MAMDLKVSTQYLNNQSKNFMSENSAKISRLSDQIASGKFAKDYTDLVEVTSIEGLLSNKENKLFLESKVQNNTNLISKLSEIERIEKEFTSLIRESLKICQLSGSPAIASSFDTVGLVNNQLKQIESLLNSSFQSQKLFAGGKTDVSITVEDLVNNSNIVNGGVTANYYNGDSFIASYQISRETNLEYGINADDPVFQNLIAAHHYMISGDYSTANDMLQQAKNDISTLSIKTGTNMSLLKNQINNDTKTILSLSLNISAIEDTDILKSMMQLSELETQLKASFMLTNRIADLSLVNYLR